MALFAQVSSIVPNQGTTDLNVGVEILKGINNAARNSNADFGLLVTVAYTSVNNTLEIIASPRLSIATDTQFVGAFDNRLVIVQLTLSYAGHPAPAANTTYSGTAQIVHKDPLTGVDVELGPAEQSSV